MSEPKILIWDVETSEIISAHYGLYNISIRPDRILNDWFMMSAAWKWYGEKKIHSVSLLDDKERLKNNSFDIRNMNVDDYVVVKKLHEVLDEADVFVYHNGDKFDLKKFNARAIYHGLPPISPNKIKIDTLKIARKNFAITSNSLDYLCQYFGISGKMSLPKGTFQNAMMCDEKALKTLVKYNKKDISPSLEGLFEKLKPYIHQLNYNLFTNAYACPKCQSHDIERRGYKYTGATRKAQVKCNTCGGWSLVKHTDRSAEVRPC